MNTEEFGAMVEEAMPRFYTYARRLTYDEEDAEDIVQEALLKAYRQVDKLAEDPARYVARAVYSAHIDLVRKKKRHHELPLDLDPFYYDDELIKALMRKELGERLAKCARNLTDQCRSFLDDFAQDFSYEEIAKRQGVAVGTVRTTLFRAKKAMRDMLGDLESHLL